jgi:hypothetical protein
MRATIQRACPRITRPWMIVIAAIAVSSSGCGGLVFEKETMLFSIAPERDAAKALLVYEGFFVAGTEKNDLESAQDELSTLFKDRQAFCFGNPMFLVDLSSTSGRDDDAGALSAFAMRQRKIHSTTAGRDDDTEQRKTLEFQRTLREFLRKHLSITSAQLFISRTGKLCGHQAVTVRGLRDLIAGINERISEQFAQDTSEALRDKKKRGPEWDDESLRLVQAAARNHYAWIRVDDGRISFTCLARTPSFRI